MTLVTLVVILIIVILSVIVIMKYRTTISYHDNRLKLIPSQVYQSQYGSIEYLLQGEGPTILISHGVTGGVDQGIGMTRDFLGSGYRVLYVSRFGYLKSSIPDSPSPELQADVYHELLDHLGIYRVFIFGNSAGGTSAIHFAIQYTQQCQGLILLSSNAPLDTPSGHPPMFIFQSNFLYWLGMTLVGKWMMSMFVPQTVLDTLPKSEQNRIIQAIYFSALPVTKRSKGIEFDLFTSNPSINNQVAFNKITSPTLIINAIDDPATRIEGAQTLSRNIPRSSLVTYKTGGHILLGQEDNVKQEIRDFIKSNTS
ncbi:MAG: alpha/beta hydrolase [Candidatus Bathyarchaeota archaeon]|nr:alpha/beta hydrolase [Candidatus Bathyarchaeota archaeon]